MCEDRPRIHSRKARHAWVVAGEKQFGQHDVAMLCLRCGQGPSVADPDSFQVTHAKGCAGRRFTGRLRRSDEVEFDLNGVAMQGVLLRRCGRGHAHVKIRDVYVVPVKDLRPVLAQEALAAQRRAEYLQAHGAGS